MLALRKPLIAVLIGAAAVAGPGCGTESTPAESDEPGVTTAASKPKGDPAVNKNTRYFLNKMSVCEVSAGLVLLAAQEGKSSDFELADNTTQARDACENVGDQLLSADTDHFDDEASTGWYAVDRYKSGLNAILAYIDNPRPSKLVEARDKLQEADQGASEAQRSINKRRRVYGLRPYHP